MVDWNKVPSEAVDVVFAQENRRLLAQLEREEPQNCRDTIAWADSFAGKYESPEQERYVTLMRKSAELRLKERGLQAYGGNQNGKGKKQTGVYERTAHCT